MIRDAARIEQCANRVLLRVGARFQRFDQRATMLFVVGRRGERREHRRALIREHDERLRRAVAAHRGSQIGIDLRAERGTAGDREGRER